MYAESQRHHKDILSLHFVPVKSLVIGNIPAILRSHAFAYFRYNSGMDTENKQAHLCNMLDNVPVDKSWAKDQILIGYLLAGATDEWDSDVGNVTISYADVGLSVELKDKEKLDQLDCKTSFTPIERAMKAQAPE